jgi:hypothetical protein
VISYQVNARHLRERLSTPSWFLISIALNSQYDKLFFYDISFEKRWEKGFDGFNPLNMQGKTNGNTHEK